jgi:hypothetical protein
MASNSCSSCAYFNSLTTKLSVDPNGMGNQPIMGTVSNTNFGQCRIQPPERYYYPIYTTSSLTTENLVQWPIVHIADWCGQWSKS